jgi:tRNA(adenine34) deaminase
MMNDEDFMRLALELAKLSFDLGEVPVGALVVFKGEVVGRGYNKRELLSSPLEHAEMMAIKEAAHKLGRWRLTGATIYSTLEPCLMCAGTMLHARIDDLVFGAKDPKFGAIESLYQLADDRRLNHQFSARSGLLQEQSQELLRRFFSQLRKNHGI